MATAFEDRTVTEVRPHEDAGMAFVLAAAMVATIVAGFALNLALGRSSFAVPPVYHVHAVTFFGWVALFIIQTRLAASAAIATHRRLGKLTAALVPVLVVLAATMTVITMRRSGGPFFFAQNEFLWGNAVMLPFFAGLVGAAMARRRETAWHSRLMLGAMAMLTAPALGRILPLPLFIPWAWWVNTAAALIFPLAGMVIDKRRHGAVHPAWFWAVGTVVAAHVLGEFIAYTAFGMSTTEALVSGTSGANRPMAAYLP